MSAGVRSMLAPVEGIGLMVGDFLSLVDSPGEGFNTIVLAPPSGKLLRFELELAYQLAIPGGALIVCGISNSEAPSGVGWELQSELIWVVTQKGQIDDAYDRGSKPQQTHQRLLYYLKPSLKGKGPAQPHYYQDVGGGSVWFADPDPEGGPLPVAIADRLIRMTCPVNGKVLDLYCGSGSILLAAHRLHREALGLSTDEGAVDRICTRILGGGHVPTRQITPVLPSAQKPVGMCPSTKADYGGKDHAPNGWVELNASGKKTLFRWKDGKRKLSRTLQSRSEEVLVRILIHHRYHHSDTLERLEAFRQNRGKTLEELGKLLPDPHLQALLDAEETDLELQHVIEGLGIVFS